MRLWWLGLISGVFLDQCTKQWAQQALSFHTSITIIADKITFDLVHNYGAAYGILQHQRGFLIAVSISVIVICAVFFRSLAQSEWSKYGLMFLLIGTLGNLIDRTLFGYVIDFINIRIFPVFNIADICIDIGIGCFIVDLFKSKSTNVST